MGNSNNKESKCWLVQCMALASYEMANNERKEEWFKVCTTLQDNGYQPESYEIKKAVRQYIPYILEKRRDELYRKLWTYDNTIIVLRVANIECGIASDECKEQMMKTDEIPEWPYRHKCFCYPDIVN